MLPSTLDMQQAVCYLESHEADGSITITKRGQDGVVIVPESYEVGIILDVYCRSMWQVRVDSVTTV